MKLTVISRLAHASLLTSRAGRVAFALAIVIATSAERALADPITIKLGGKADNAGTVTFKFDEREPFNGAHSYTVTVAKNDSAASVLDKIANDGVMQGFYTMARSQEMIGGKPVESITITPKPGIANFKGASYDIDIRTNPKFQFIFTKVDAAVPGKAGVKLLPGFEPADPSTDWRLYLFSNAGGLLGVSEQLDVPSSLSAPDLIGLFAADFSSQGFPVVASGAELSLFSETNHVFGIEEGGLSPFSVQVSNRVPEPALLAMLVVGVCARLLRATTRPS